MHGVEQPLDEVVGRVAHQASLLVLGAAAARAAAGGRRQRWSFVVVLL